MAEVKEYTEVVVKVGKSFVMAYAPKDYYINPGDEVELENGNRGVALVYNRYVSFDRLCEIEKQTDEEFVKIKAIYSKEEVVWDE